MNRKSGAVYRMVTLPVAWVTF